MQNILLCVSLALIGGLFMSRLARWVGLPAVTAYLVTGLLLGPYCLGGLGLAGIGFHTMADVSAMAIIPDAALGFIAFTIGNEFRLDDLRHMGRQAVTIGILQAVATTVFVDAALVGLHFLVPGSISIPSAITLGAIAAATAIPVSRIRSMPYPCSHPQVGTAMNSAPASLQRPHTSGNCMS